MDLIKQKLEGRRQRDQVEKGAARVRVGSPRGAWSKRGKANHGQMAKTWHDLAEVACHPEASY